VAHPTVHTLTFNAALVAKMIVTLDQISHGRARLNVVSDWYTEKLRQMGLWPANITHTECYDVAREWVQALKRLWSEERVTFAGKYIKYIHLDD
jgi:pyrimidine oxygenase